MLGMSENKTNLGDILGGMMGTTAPMMTGLIRSMLSPGMIKSVTGMIPDLLGGVAEAISSIDLWEILSSTSGAILPAPMDLLDSVNLLGPLVDAVASITEVILDVIVRILEIVGPLLVAIGPIFKFLMKAVGPMLEALRKGFGALFGSST